MCFVKQRPSKSRRRFVCRCYRRALKTFGCKNGNHKKLLDGYPKIDGGEFPTFTDEIRKADALISLYFHIPFPEKLDDEVWIEKFRQIEWLADKGLLGAKQSPQNADY
ncbi:MAG: hypothetical protein II956_14375 [Bacteroidales bacterium]|nr:hypothetical protein [Bacteroidales bacterium]